MGDATALAEAIRSLEAGETGREVDAKICAACGIWPTGRPDWAAGSEFTLYADGGRLLACRIEREGRKIQYTDTGWERDPPPLSTSIDAAVTLVPEGYYWRIDAGGDDHSANIWVQPQPPDNRKYQATAAPEAAALTLAALRARLAMLENRA